MSASPSRWIYPLPINHEFREKYWKEGSGDDYQGKNLQNLLATTVRNLTQDERSDLGEGPNPERYKNTLGRETLPVHVNDIVEPSWTKIDSDMFELTEVMIDCIVCTTGAGNGGIFSACEDYRDIENVTRSSDKLELQPETQPGVTIPSLSGDPQFPSDACAICAFTLCTAEGCEEDQSAPFAVLQKNRDKRWIFNENTPNGTEFDETSFTPSPSSSSIPEATATLTTVAQDSEDDSDKSELALAIVTPIVLVFAGAVLLWILLTKRRNKRRAMAQIGQPASSIFPVNSNFHRLVDPPAVSRRQETDINGEAPPSYSEAVRDRRIIEGPEVTTQPR